MRAINLRRMSPEIVDSAVSCSKEMLLIHLVFRPSVRRSLARWLAGVL